MSASLVGSEMCIRDSPWRAGAGVGAEAPRRPLPVRGPLVDLSGSRGGTCLLYTSDAADDM
eukprot:3452852-Alexandrium_andersonii.AAC.1